jgi:hypothetical protein
MLVGSSCRIPFFSPPPVSSPGVAQPLSSTFRSEIYFGTGSPRLIPLECALPRIAAANAVESALVNQRTLCPVKSALTKRGMSHRPPESSAPTLRGLYRNLPGICTYEIKDFISSRMCTYEKRRRGLRLMRSFPLPSRVCGRHWNGSTFPVPPLLPGYIMLGQSCERDARAHGPAKRGRGAK